MLALLAEIRRNDIKVYFDFATGDFVSDMRNSEELDFESLMEIDGIDDIRMYAGF